MFKNMKIQINDQQTLDDIVSELERLGYYKDEDPVVDAENFIHTYKNGSFDFWLSDLLWGELTTLAELKEM